MTACGITIFLFTLFNCGLRLIEGTAYHAPI